MHIEDVSQIADLLKRTRKAKRILQKELAKRTGLSLYTLGKYERGERVPTIDRLILICQELDLSWNIVRHKSGRDLKSSESQPKRSWGGQRGERCPNAKLTEADVREIRARKAQGESYNDLAKAYGVSRHRLTLIAKGQAWRHVK